MDSLFNGLNLNFLNDKNGNSNAKIFFVLLMLGPIIFTFCLFLYILRKRLRKCLKKKHRRFYDLEYQTDTTFSDSISEPSQKRKVQNSKMQRLKSSKDKRRKEHEKLLKKYEQESDEESSEVYLVKNHKKNVPKKFKPYKLNREMENEKKMVKKKSIDCVFKINSKPKEDKKQEVPLISESSHSETTESDKPLPILNHDKEKTDHSEKLEEKKFNLDHDAKVLQKESNQNPEKKKPSKEEVKHESEKKN